MLVLNLMIKRARLRLIEHSAPQHWSYMYGFKHGSVFKVYTNDLNWQTRPSICRFRNQRLLLYG
jgi:hypothetical protein